MDTFEHLALGNSLTINTYGNPFLPVDDSGQVAINMQRFGEDGLPRSVAGLSLQPGEIIALAGDYFTDKNWDMKLYLPECRSFKSIEELGRYLIQRHPHEHEENALYMAYQNLASDEVKPEDIQRIFSIVSTDYIPFSKTLNGYMQNLMLYLRVKDYGEMLDRNQTHFTPWAVRCYILGHHMALQYARFSWFLNQLSENHLMQPPDALCEALSNQLIKGDGCSPEDLRRLAHQYHALSLGIECFSFHYYTDHFAAGHMSQMGDLRKALPQKFKLWGSILTNNIHNELNRVGAFTKRPYDPTPNPEEPPVTAHGDGSFENCLNAFNKEACINGMQHSLSDIDRALKTGKMRRQTKFGGLEHLPDVDYQYRQHQPLLLMQEGIIYRRKHPSKIKRIKPSDYEAMQANPLAHGYVELKTKWQAFKLVAKLRLLPFAYEGRVATVSEAYRQATEEDEAQRNPKRQPVPAPPCEDQPLFDERSPKKARKNSLRANRFFEPADAVDISAEEPLNTSSLSA